MSITGQELSQMPDGASSQARRTVIDLPMLSDRAAARLLATVADRSGLIVLLDGGERVPVFQLDERGEMRRDIEKINFYLRAADEPWAAAEWWVSNNPEMGWAEADGVDRQPRSGDSDFTGSTSAAVRDDQLRVP